MKKDFCCNDMKSAILDYNIINYDDIVRKYLIYYGKNSCYPIKVCPWCGKELKKQLVQELYNTLENEFGILIIADDFSKVPPEFQSDEWWKKRGL
jgi:hypothetical protein